MTCITVVSDGTRCCMACDSQASNDGTVAVLAESKIARVGPLLIAAEGSFAITQYARRNIYQPGEPDSHHVRAFGIDWPKPEDSLSEWAERFGNMIWANFKERGKLIRVREGDEIPGQTLIARGSEWVLLDGVGNVVRFGSPWWAIGSGAAEARGAMFAATGICVGSEGAAVDAVATLGVRAAIELDDGCCGPVRHEWTEP